MSNLGFIGLGIMGRPMAGHLVAGGHKLFLHGHGTSPKELLDKGGVSCSNARDVARCADIIITMVHDTANVEDALFGREGASEGLSPGKIIVDMSSISPIGTVRLTIKERKRSYTAAMPTARGSRFGFAGNSGLG